MAINWWKFTFIYYLVLLQQFPTSSGLPKSSEVASDAPKTIKLSSLHIDNSLNEFRQDNPKLINILKEHYMIPPSKMPYNFSRTNINLDGQFGQAAYIGNTFFVWVFLIV